MAELAAKGFEVAEGARVHVPSATGCTFRATLFDVAEIVTVTLDTNVLDDADVRRRVEDAAARRGLVADVCTVTVNRRERGGPRTGTEVAEPFVWDESPWGDGAWSSEETVAEMFVLDETPLGDGVLAGAADVSRFEAILRIISSGSFPRPGERAGLTAPQWRQLRDAMSLEAHAREGRDVFVTADRKGFVSHGRRETLERLCRTRIVTPDELGTGWP